MKILLADNNNKEEWNRYVATNPVCSPYHLWAWKQSVEEAYNHKGYYLYAETGNKICGILPIIHMELPFIQNQLVSLPFCDIGAPLADSPEIETRLLDEAVTLGKELGAKKIEIRNRNSSDSTNSTVQPHSKVSMLLKLPDSSNDLWDGFKSKLRSQVRKAEKNGLIFQWGQLSEIDSFYTVISRNMHELGSPVHSKKWFKAVFANYGDNAKMGFVSLKKKPIGCGIILSCGKTVSTPWASTSREYNRLGPNMLLYWKFLEFSADNEFDLFDFGRSTIDKGTYKFKSQWGANPTPLEWRTLFPFRHAAMNDGASSSKRELAEKIWRKIPANFAGFLGPMIRKHISL